MISLLFPLIAGLFVVNGQLSYPRWSGQGLRYDNSNNLRLFPAPGRQGGSNSFSRYGSRTYPARLVSHGSFNGNFNPTVHSDHRVTSTPKIVSQRYMQTSPVHSCAQKGANCVLTRAVPFERRFYMTPFDCVQLCLNSVGDYGIQCRSVIYNWGRIVSCDLFEAGLRTRGVTAVQGYGHDLYSIRESCLQIPGTVVVPTSSASPVTTITPKTTTTTTSTMTTTTIGSPRNTCPTGQQSVMLRTEGYQLFGYNGGIQRNIAERDCSSLCRANKNCLSIDYDIRTRLCIISSEAAGPAGDGVLEKKSDSVYLEKMCLSESVADNCRQTLTRFPQKQLVGFTQDLSDSSSLADCVEKCLNSMALFSFECFSAMFYYTDISRGSNCVLNFADHNEAPDLFLVEMNELVTTSETCWIVSGEPLQDTLYTILIEKIVQIIT